MTENKGITLLYISNGIHFKLSSLSAKSSAYRWTLFLFVLSFHLDGIEKNCIFAVDNTTENDEETIIANSYRSADTSH